MSKESHSRHERWLKHGLNVAVLVFATVVIVVFANVIAREHVWQRWDFTQDSRHSLSEQSIRVLEKLDAPVHIYTLYEKPKAGGALLGDDQNASEEDRRREQFRKDAARYFTKVEDLLEEYGRRSKQIQFKRVDPSADVAAYESFRKELLARYEKPIAAAKAAVAEAQKVMTERATDTQKLVEPLNAKLQEMYTTFGAAVSDFNKQQQEGKATTGQIAVVRRLKGAADTLQIIRDHFARQADDMKRIDEAVKKAMDEPLPRYDALVATIQQDLRGEQEFLSGAADRLKDMISAHTAGAFPELSAPMLEFLKGQTTEYQSLVTRLSGAVARLEEVKLGEYGRTRDLLQSRNSIVLISDKPAAGQQSGITALDLAEVFRAPAGEAEPPEKDPRSQRQREPRFVGEEIITGTLARLTMASRPKVVFVHAYQAQVLGMTDMQGQFTTYTNVAERLRNLNFDVSEWSPMPMPGPVPGMPPSRMPKPQADPGQTMILVALPAPPPNPQMPFNPGALEAEGFVFEHIKAGGPAFVITPPTQITGPSVNEPRLPRLLTEFGIGVDQTRMVMTERLGRNQEMVAIPTADLTAWPSDHPISRALSGLRGMMYLATSLQIKDVPQGVKAWPVIRSPESSWADDASREEIQQGKAKRDGNDPAGPLTIAVAAEKESQRIVAIGDMFWGTDTMAARPNRDDVAIDASTGQVVALSYMYPANGEFMVNSFLWLAQLDGLIAASSRTQDIGRIGEVTPEGMTMARIFVLGVLPVGCLICGVVVWTTRRR